MKISFLLLLMSFIFLCCSNNSTETSDDNGNDIPDLPGWKLVWNEEFDGTHIATTRWNYEVNGRGGGNNELQYYTDRQENAFVENGIHKINYIPHHLTRNFL